MRGEWEMSVAPSRLAARGGLPQRMSGLKGQSVVEAPAVAEAVGAAHGAGHTAFTRPPQVFVQAKEDVRAELEPLG